MAIMKMKRLRLMLVRSRKEEVLRELAKLGCVEFSELEGELQESGLSDQVKRESSALMALKTKQAVLDSISTSKDQLSGVSLDEEAANMMTFVTSYNAAARLMTAIDETLQSLLGIT